LKVVPESAGSGSRGGWCDSHTLASNIWPVPRRGIGRLAHLIAKPNEIPVECGVMVFQNNLFEVTRMAPKMTVSELPFAVWMALTKATPRRGPDLDSAQEALTCG
jgi:hypothetical protein